MQKRTSSIHEHETHTQKHKFETWRGDHQGTKENTKARFPYITNNIEKIIIRIFLKIYIYIYVFIKVGPITFHYFIDIDVNIYEDKDKDKDKINI